jgi:hypothetical protein
LRLARDAGKSQRAGAEMTWSGYSHTDGEEEDERDARRWRRRAAGPEIWWIRWAPLIPRTILKINESQKGPLITGASIKQITLINK